MTELTGCAANNQPWTEKEDQIITENYGKLSFPEIQKLIPNRTSQALQHRRRALGIPTKNTQYFSTNVWTEEELSLLKENAGKLTLQELEELLGHPWTAINTKICKMKKKGLIDKHKFDRELWAEEEDQLLIEYYEEDVNHVLTLLPKRTKKAIHHRWRLLKPDHDKRTQRTHNVNMNFFSEPSLLNSYWAGFIAADGCLTEKKHLLSIGLQSRDGYHLEQFAKDCGFEGKVVYSTIKEGYTKASLYIWGVQQWFTDLGKYFNLTPRKSLTLKPPNITDEDCIKAYIKGYIDGDGGIYERVGRNRWVLGIAGTEAVLNWIKSYIEGWSPAYSHKTARVIKPAHVNIHVYRISGIRSLAVLRMLSKIETPCLQRKWKSI
jgi:hypothetical protein